MAKPKGIFTSKYSQFKYGVGLGVEQFVVSDLESLVSLNDKGFAPDWVIRVTTLRASFRLVLGSQLTADGITVINSNSGRGQWIRDLTAADTYWHKQPAWYIDAVNGNDENAGITQSSPLKTFAEWARRIANVVKTATTVNVLSSIPESDPFPSSLCLEKNLTVAGTLIETSSGTFTSVTPLSTATNEEMKVAKSSGNWTTDVDKLLYDVNVDAWGFVTKDVGSNSEAYVTQFAPLSVSSMGNALATLANGHVYKLYNIQHSIYMDKTVSWYGSGDFIFADLIVYGGEYVPTYKYTRFMDCSCSVNFIRCAFERSAPSVGVFFTITDSNIGFHCCRIGSVESGGVTVQTSICGGYMNLDVVFLSGTTEENSSLNAYGFGGGVSIAYGGLTARYSSMRWWDMPVIDFYGPICMFNSPYHGLEIGNSAVRIQGGYGNSAGKFIGKDIAQYGLYVWRSRITGASATNCYVTGTTGDILIGGKTQLMPEIDASAGAVLPAAAPCTTWAQFAAAPFSGKLIDYTSATYFGP